jgi:putative protease
MNSKAEAFYRQHGVEQIEPAFEKVAQREVPLMFCKHCLRFSMGWCPKQQQGRSPYREPYYLVASDGKRFRLEFDCKLCQMKLYHEEDAPRG